MKKIAISLVSVFVSLTAAADSLNLNHISCAYSLSKSGWNLISIFSTSSPFDLARNETRYLVGGYSGQQPNPDDLNSAFCISMSGTGNSDFVIINKFLYKAKEFQNVNQDCSVVGRDVSLVSTKFEALKRGNYTEVQMSWIPANPDHTNLMIRTYLPKYDEIEKIGEIAEQKCLTLTPPAAL